jgi:alkylhydroperoxidase/carboxymuconolactone decarboxylase family protein YurZ
LEKKYPAFYAPLEDADPKLHEIMKSLYDASMGEGALDSKTKVLIAMTVDAFAGSDEGVKGLSMAARSLGATEQQISEALRIAHMVAANKVLHSSLSATKS